MRVPVTNSGGQRMKKCEIALKKYERSGTCSATQRHTCETTSPRFDQRSKEAQENCKQVDFFDELLELNALHKDTNHFHFVAVVGLQMDGVELMVVTVRFWSFIRAAGICTKLRNAPTPEPVAHPSYVHLFLMAN